MKTIKPKICKCCGKEFIPYTSLVKYCSYKCENKMAKEKDKIKKAKIKEKKKVSISFLSKKCDLLWSEVIRNIGKCEYCGKKEFLNAHHITSRCNKSVRWELSNGICLCSGCHTFSSKFSAHLTPYEFSKWLEKYKGIEYMDKLLELSHIPLRVTTEFLLEKMYIFKQILDN